MLSECFIITILSILACGGLAQNISAVGSRGQVTSWLSANVPFSAYDQTTVLDSWGGTLYRAPGPVLIYDFQLRADWRPVPDDQQPSCMLPNNQFGSCAAALYIHPLSGSDNILHVPVENFDWQGAPYSSPFDFTLYEKYLYDQYDHALWATTWMYRQDNFLSQEAVNRMTYHSTIDPSYRVRFPKAIYMYKGDEVRMQIKCVQVEVTTRGFTLHPSIPWVVHGTLNWMPHP